MHAYLPDWDIQKLRNDMFTSAYGFKVDYLAEILKNLRKEDYIHDYKRFFDLSSTITTRDRDSIAKTFAGLMKVINPHGELTKKEARELLEFYIEGRKRVKLQLQKMDETFLTDQVDFSYSDKETGKKNRVKTLEDLQYGEVELPNLDLKIDHTEPSIVNEENSIPLTVSEELIVKTWKDPKEGRVIRRDNQKGISFQKLFWEFLIEATEVIITDPYIRLPHHFRNRMEFIELVTKKVNLVDEIKVHLVTVNSEEYFEWFKDKLDQLNYSLEPMEISFSFEFGTTIHDWSIVLNNGWKIVLGRGLDIWQKINGWFDLREFLQEKR